MLSESGLISKLRSLLAGARQVTQNNALEWGGFSTQRAVRSIGGTSSDLDQGGNTASLVIVSNLHSFQAQRHVPRIQSSRT